MSRIFSKLTNAKRCWAVLATGAAIAVILALAGGAPTNAHNDNDDGAEASKILIGFAISPVELNLKRKNRALVGLGSYIINAQAGCSDCHTFPQYAVGGNPFLGEPEETRADRYLAGGRAFGPFISRNLTPDDDGLPAGMTFDEFEEVIRTGIDRAHIPPHVPAEDHDLLQVMPWPVFRNMTDRHLRAIYEYLSAIPSIP